MFLERMTSQENWSQSYVPVKSVSIALIIQWDKVHHEHVVRIGIHVTKLDLKGWKHTSPGLGYDHLGSELVKFVPKRFGLELYMNVLQFRVQRLLVHSSCTAQVSATGIARSGLHIIAC